MGTDKRSGRPAAAWAGTGLLLTRVVIGTFWLGQLTWKLPPGFGCPHGGFCMYVHKEIQYPLIPLYADFLRWAVVPIIYVWAWVTTLVEVAVGLSLLCGLLTRLGGLIGLLWSLNLLVGISGVPHEDPPAYIMLAVFGALFLLEGAGPRANLDTRVVRPWLQRAPSSRWTTLVAALT